MIYTMVYELATHRFLRGGTLTPEYNPALEGIEAYAPENPPDLVVERHDPASQGKRRPATAPEQAAAVAAQRDSRSDAELAQALNLATVDFVLRQVLGRAPTGPERTAARQQFRAVLRAILDQ